jgi:hypothetical protein
MSNTTNSSPVYRTLDTRWITRRTRFQLRILRHHKREGRVCFIEVAVCRCGRLTYRQRFPDKRAVAR